MSPSTMRRWFWTGVLVPLLLSACDNDHGGFPADNCAADCLSGDELLVIEPARSLLLVGSKLAASATLVDSDGRRLDVTDSVLWRSDDSRIASVAVEGDLKGVASGQTAITAKLGMLAARADVRVSALAVSQIDVSPAYRHLLPGHTLQYAAVAVLADGSKVDVTRNVLWSSDHAAVASIDASGRANGVAEGVTKIAARYGQGSTALTDTALLAVYSTAVTIKSFYIEPRVLEAAPGARATFRAFAVTSDDRVVDVTSATLWQSSDSAVDKIDATGIATALAVGSAEIRATLAYGTVNRSATATFKVTAPAIAELRVSPQWADLLVGQQQAYKAEAITADHKVIDVTRLVRWQSSAPAVASVGVEGLASAVAGGQTTVSAELRYQGQRLFDDGVLKVETPPTLNSLSIAPGHASILVDEDLRYRCVGVFSDESPLDAACQWSVDDEAVAVVDELTGVLTGIGAGKTKVRARLFYGGRPVDVSAGVEVIRPIGVDSLQVTPASAEAVVFSTRQFEAYLAFTDGRKVNVTAQVAWRSDDEDVATVSAQGLARGLAPGQTQIHAATVYEGIEYTDAAPFMVPQPDVTVEELRVLPPLRVTYAGGFALFDAELLLSDGSPVSVTDLVQWTVLDRNVAASAAQPGKFVGLRTGETALRASIDYQGVEYASTARLSVVDLDRIAGVEINPPEPLVSVDGDLQLQALLLLDGSEPSDVTSLGRWTSGDARIAAVDASGLLTGASVGTVAITVADNSDVVDLSASVNARVVDPAAHLVELRVSPSSTSTMVGKEARFHATAVYLDGTREDVSSQAEWRITNAAVAHLASQDGSVWGKAEGTTAITAAFYAGGIEVVDSAELVVKPAPITITEIQVTPARARVVSGGTAHFTAVAVLSDFSRVEITSSARWRTSDTSIAQASRPLGDFATFQQGDVTISATLISQGQTYTGAAQLHVTAPAPVSLEVTPPILQLTIGEHQALQAILRYTDGSTEDVTASVLWQSQDSSVAAVSSAANRGVVAGAGSGSTQVTAALSVQRLAAAATVQVRRPALLGIEIIPATATVAAGLTQRFTAIGVYDDESSLDITARARWSSSAESVAKIVAGDAQGLVRGVAPGAVTIRAALEGVTGNAALTVGAAIITSVLVGPADARIEVGETQAFVAIARLSDGSAREITDEVTWVSSNAAAASVSNEAASAGTALGVVAGGTQIRAYYKGTLQGVGTLEVVPPTITLIVVTPAASSVSVGSHVYYTATAILSNATQIDVSKFVTWTSSSDAVASISNGKDHGRATALAGGSITVTATKDNVVGQTSLTVTALCSGKPGSMSIESDVTLRVGATAQLQVTGFYPDGCSQEMTDESATVWRSSNDDVFKVGNKTGLVTGIGVGSALVEIKNRGKVDTATVTVVP